jgi:hypothetical protein
MSDLNDHLFAQIERLSDENLKPEQIEIEAKRGAGIVAAADSILKGVALQIQAAKVLSDHGIDPTSRLPVIETKALVKK